MHESPRRLPFAAAAVAIFFGVPAYAQTCTPTAYSAAQVSQAIQNSPNANQTLKNSSCSFGGAAQSESGGNLCSSNAGNSGILQLNNGAIANAGYTPQSYMALPLQSQVNVWSQQVGNSNTSSTGYTTLSNAMSSGNGAINGTPVTSGMLAACFQFGAAVCNNDVALLQSGQAIPTAGQAGSIPCTNSSCNGGTANQDGNGQNIQTWGGNIQKNINAAANSCATNAPGTGAGCPSPTTTGTATPTNATQPTNPADVNLPANAATNYQQYVGKYQGVNQQCVSLTRALDPSLPPSSLWKQGAQVQGDTGLAPGTPIATFNFNGNYGPPSSPGGDFGVSHTGIYLGQDASGVQILNQWNNSGGAQVTTIPWNSWNGNTMESGNKYYVIAN